MSVKEKVAYLSGLMDGLEFDKSSKEGKMFEAILDVLDEMADEVEIIADDLEELEEFVDALDEDVEELEALLDDDDDDDDEEEEDDDLVNVRCPACGHQNTFDPAVLWEDDDDDEVEILCSNCGAVVFSSDLFGDDFDDDDDEDDD